MVDGYLLDTNVLSEIRRDAPSFRVSSFIKACPLQQQYISTVTITEIHYGIDLLTDAAKRADLQVWLDTELRSVYAGQILEVTEDILLRWRFLIASGRKANRTYSPLDSLIAATALHHNLALVTRNIRDFESMGLSLINPWERAA